MGGMGVRGWMIECPEKLDRWEVAMLVNRINYNVSTLQGQHTHASTSRKISTESSGTYSLMIFSLNCSQQ